jgi:cellulose synthase/poly-beta-1,6-N-acetylglucosamine synthase-like glycosyltransferase
MTDTLPPPREPSIAVIVPNYNDARHLLRCIGSVLDQAVGPDELIVVDDKSTDDSVAAIRPLIAGHAHARLVENPVNLGVYGAVDEGLKRSRSEYALFLAANDYVLPGIFARAKACLARAPGAGVWSALAWIVDEQDRLLRLHPSPIVALHDAYIPAHRCIEFAHSLGNWFTGTTLIYRRDALEEAGRFDPVYMGMADLFTALIVASRHGAAYTPEPYAAIRMHGNSHLTRTLSNPAGLADILERMCAHGQRTVPALFTPEFVGRTVRRFLSASVRTTGGAAIAAIADRSQGWTARALRAVARLVPASWRLPRVVLGFLILRPFDVLPTAWYRALGWIWVRSRARWPG